jgi:deoxycytidine triphosphate deaminase
MRKEEFRTWLLNIDCKSGAQTSDHISRVKRIEKAFSQIDSKYVDVDNECRKDYCENLLNRLSLIYENQEVNLPDNKMGMARLRSSLRKYVAFYKWSDNKNIRSGSVH